MKWKATRVDDCTYILERDHSADPEPPSTDYDRGYSDGCDVKNRHLEPCPQHESDEYKMGFSAGLGDRGSYYRKWDL